GRGQSRPPARPGSSAGPRGGCGRRTGRRRAGPGPGGWSRRPPARRCPCARPAAGGRPRSARLARGSARRTPEGGDQPGDGRRVGPDGDADEQPGGEDDFGGGVGNDADGGEGGGRRDRAGWTRAVGGESLSPGVEGGLAHALGGAEGG